MPFSPPPDVKLRGLPWFGNRRAVRPVVDGFPWFGNKYRHTDSFAATLAGSSTLSAGLTTAIRLAATPAAVATMTGALSTGIPLAAAPAAVATLTGAITTGIPLAADATTVVSLVGGLTTGILLAAAPAAVATMAADLTASAPTTLATELTVVSTLAGDLSTGIVLSAALVDAVTLVGALTTDIALVAAPAAVATLTGALGTAIHLAAAPSARATLTGVLGTSIHLATAMAGSATLTGTLSAPSDVAARPASIAAVQSDVMPNIPEPTGAAGSILSVLKAIKLVVDILTGKRGKPLQKAVTFFDLARLGITDGTGTTVIISGGGTSGVTSLATGAALTASAPIGNVTLDLAAISPHTLLGNHGTISDVPGALALSAHFSFSGPTLDVVGFGSMTSFNLGTGLTGGTLGVVSNGDTIVNAGVLLVGGVAGTIHLGTNLSISGGDTLDAAGGGGGMTVVRPHSVYLGGAAGRLSTGFYAGGGGNAAAHEEGIQTVASLGTDSVAELRFQIPAVLPPGTMKLHCKALANATSGAAKITISDAMVAAGASPSAATLTGEIQQTVTWAAGGADKYNEFKLTLTPTPTVGNALVVAVTFNTTGWTLAQIGTFQFSLIWE